jgi:hypothetical protein
MGLEPVPDSDARAESDRWAGVIFACTLLVCATAIICAWILR